MRITQAFLLTMLFLCGFTAYVSAQDVNDVDYQVQGEYTGAIQAGDGKVKYGVQVVAWGGGKFSGVGYMGGLPGNGWDKSEPTRTPEATIEDGILKLESQHATVLVSPGVMTIKIGGDVVGKLKRVVRKSPTLGKRTPTNGVVLFAGKDSVDQWALKGKPGQVTDDGLLMQGTASKRKFQDHKIHIEFLLPFKPKARGQQRGNSGIYVQGRYEVQMLDSFGLSGKNNECGGVYSIRKPDVNMCFPPMQWQTYDIDFHAAKFQGDKKIENAWMKVEHNGVTIHEHVELPKKTTAAPLNESADPGFIFLQDHGNQVRYRNIWVVPSQQELETDESLETPPNQSAKKLAINIPIEMDYLLYLPKDYDEKQKWPLVLFLHGAGERGNNLEKVKIHGPPKLAAAGKEFPFIVVSPQCKSDRWWEPIPLGALLDQVERDYNVDADRVYVTGLSMGGFGTWSLASYYPKRFAAIAPICGGGDAMKTAYTIGKNLPIWVFHGAKDRVVPLARSQTLVDAFKKKGADIQFTVYPEASHDSWTETYNNQKLYEWMMSHSRSN